MKRSTRIGTVTAVGITLLWAAVNDTSRGMLRGLPSYVQNSISRALSGSPKDIDKKQKESNELVDFRTAEHELISKWYALLSSSQNSVLETGKYDGRGHTYIGHLRARTISGLQQIVSEIRELSKSEEARVLLTGGCESWNHNKHIEKWKSHSAGYKLDIAFSSKMWLNSAGDWLLPWLESKIWLKPDIWSKYSFSLTNKQKIDVFYEKDHLDIRFL